MDSHLSPWRLATTISRMALALWVALAAAPTTHGAQPVETATAPRLIAPGQEPAPCTPALVEHQLWLISSRAAPSCNGITDSVDRLRYSQADETGRWMPSSLDAFLASDDPAVATIFWLHGNQADANGANEMGRTWYRRLTNGSSIPMRFVIWSWPSQRIDGSLREDARVKAARSEAHGYYLAWLAAQIQPDVKMTLVGYSYGARFATSALHLLGGGSLGSLQLSSPRNGSPLRAVLLAAALDNDWLAPGHHHGRALESVDELVVLVNECDPALRFYPLICPRSHAVALGREGVWSWTQLGELRNRVVQYDVSPTIGRNHDWRRYATSGRVLRLIRQRAEIDELNQPTQHNMAFNVH